MDSQADKFFERNEQWHSELSLVREILLQEGLTEDLKWGKPCYTANGGNIAILQPMKSFLSLMFFKGALLKDPDQLLESQGPNTQSAMRVTFKSPDDVRTKENGLRALISEAVNAEVSGLKVARKISVEMPQELEDALAEDSELSAAFDALTAGRQRGYAMYFAQAKQSATRTARIEKSRDKIFAGKGFQER